MEVKNRGCVYDKLVFIHLAKTAGGTLKNEIARQDNINPVFIYGEDSWQNYSSVDHNVIYGHPSKWLFGNIGKQLPNIEGKVVYITFLRNPILRTISHYYHLRNVDKGIIGDRIREFPDINVFFKECYHWEFENYFCRILSNDKKVTSNRDMEAKFLAAIDIVRKDIAFVGFQEFFEYSLYYLNGMFGLKLSPEKNINMGSYSLLDVYPETFEIIKGLNFYDIKLYNMMLSDFLAG